MQNALPKLYQVPRTSESLNSRGGGVGAPPTRSHPSKSMGVLVYSGISLYMSIFVIVSKKGVGVSIGVGMSQCLKTCICIVSKLILFLMFWNQFILN